MVKYLDPTESFQRKYSMKKIEEKIYKEMSQQYNLELQTQNKNWQLPKSKITKEYLNFGYYVSIKNDNYIDKWKSA